jgi:hypothetical protein
MTERTDHEPDEEYDIPTLVASVPKPTDEQVRVGVLAIDEYYNGTKDAPFEGSVAYVYRAMKALEQVKP